MFLTDDDIKFLENLGIYLESSLFDYTEDFKLILSKIKIDRNNFKVLLDNYSDKNIKNSIK